MPPPILNVLEVVKKTTEFFASKGIESPRLNAELIVGHGLGLPRMRLYLEFERPVTETELGPIREMVRRRGRREPLQYVVGSVEFLGLRLKVDARALIPRPETEFMVETIASRIGKAPGRVLDLGTGSGAIALALAGLYPSADVAAVDLSEEALSLASENAASAGFTGRVSFSRSHWFRHVSASEPFDLVVSNPPYLSEAEVDAAEPEVRAFEPRQALAAGDAGFSDIAEIIANAPAFLCPGGLLALETGVFHQPRAAAAAAAAGFLRSESVRDLAGRDRIFLAWR